MKYIQISNKKFLILTYVAIGVALAAVAVLLLWFYKERLTGTEPGQATYQMWDGQQFSYSSKAKFYLGDNWVVVKDGDTKEDATLSPILYAGSTDLMLTTDMMVMNVENHKIIGKAITFTTVSNEDGLIKFKKDGKQAQTLSGFMYDGENTYIFLEPTDLYVGGSLIELGALSYAIVDYNNYVEIYDSTTCSSYNYTLMGADVIAEGETYKLDLGKDTMDQDGEETLIYSSVGKLDTITMTR